MKRSNKKKLHMVGTTHFDPVWLWTWDDGMASIRSTFRAALDRMDEDPDFIYSFSCPPVFEWIRQVDEDLFERIRKSVQKGRWQLVAGWWLEPDCSAASGESYVRQGLYGQRYLQQHFGLMSKTVFNSDSFGHSAMLPQIVKKSGMDYYVFCRPDSSERMLTDPLFQWQSADGSSLLAMRCGSEAGNGWCKDTDQAIAKSAESLDHYEHDLMVLYGVTNHGGAPTKEAIALIHTLQQDESKPYDIQFSTTDDFFESQDAGLLPIISGELMVDNFGVFSNFTEIKKNNRLAEYALLNAEKAAVLNKLLNHKPYPSEKLTQAWKDLLFNQFHDILGGACIKNAYWDARNLHGRVLQTANERIHYAIQSITKDIDLSNTRYPQVVWNLVAWNLNAFDVETQIEAEVQWAWEFDFYKGPITLTDIEGNVYPCQIIQEYSVIPGFRSRVIFKATIPSLGYKVFLVHQEEQEQLEQQKQQLEQQEEQEQKEPHEQQEQREQKEQQQERQEQEQQLQEQEQQLQEQEQQLQPPEQQLQPPEQQPQQPEQKQTLAADEWHLENDWFIIEVCKETGSIASVFDKKQGKKILAAAARPFVREDDGDTWAFNIKSYGEELGSFKLESAKILENGPVRAVFRTKSTYGHSYLEQDFILYRDLDYIDGRYKVYWRDTFKVLKLAFDIAAENPKLTTSVPYGQVSRNNDGTEFPVSEWLDVSGEQGGLSIMTDSLFAYDMKDSRVSYTLLRSGIHGDLRMPEGINPDGEYDFMGQGITEGKWRIKAHDGRWEKAKIPQLAMLFNNPVLVVAEANHPGTLPGELSFLKTEAQSTILTVLKEAEDGTGLIVRGYEYAGEPDTMKLEFNKEQASVALNFKNYEIKTVQLEPDLSMKEVNMLEY